MFTAAQAAQKCRSSCAWASTTFTAAQAAQKIQAQAQLAQIVFTAAQAAQKARRCAFFLCHGVHCRTGSSETE